MATGASVTNSLEAEPIQFYPPELARLDRHYKTFWKLFVTHLLRLQPYPGFQGVFHFNGHPVSKVDIVGVVVYRDEREKCYIYGVDDGTGVIQVCQLKRKHTVDDSDDEDTSELETELATGLERTQSESGGDFQSLTHGFELDDLLHVRGQLKTFRERNEIFAYYLAKVTDPMFEVLHMKECMSLYRNFYLKPVKIPQRAKWTIGGLSDQRQTVLVLAKEIGKTLLENVGNKDLVSVYVQDLMTVPELEQLTQNIEKNQVMSVFQEAMTSLEDQGIVYRDNTFSMNSHSKHACWKIIQHDTVLHNIVLDILRRDTSSRTTADFKGTYHLKVLKLVTRNKDYSYLKEVSMQKCLEYLEEQGKVYGGSYRGYYLAFDG